ncbi:hypothetical protein L484_013628 [Morus notabilis]|uniref:Uncharacterized protein n=1 Tax=Morus notabilis TaxID=981085 RepID=W9QX56_9ROSA|nr:hypothetical protein L484_013628 [Morus notabilis]
MSATMQILCRSTFSHRRGLPLLGSNSVNFWPVLSQPIPIHHPWKPRPANPFLTRYPPLRSHRYPSPISHFPLQQPPSATEPHRATNLFENNLQKGRQKSCSENGGGGSTRKSGDGSTVKEDLRRRQRRGDGGAAAAR